MSSIFSLVDRTFCIRNANFSPFIAKNTLTCDSFAHAHKKVLEYGYNNDSIKTAILFENNMELTNDFTEDQFEELTRFMTTNLKWDIIIIGNHKIKNTQPVDGFSHIVYSKNTSSWVYDSICIVSRRFMEKITKNNRSMIFTYALTTPHVSSTVYPSPMQIYNVGTVSNVTIEDNIHRHITFCWTPLNDF